MAKRKLYTYPSKRTNKGIDTTDIGRAKRNTSNGRISVWGFNKRRNSYTDYKGIIYEKQKGWTKYPTKKILRGF